MINYIKLQYLKHTIKKLLATDFLELDYFEYIKIKTKITKALALARKMEQKQQAKANQINEIIYTLAHIKKYGY